MYFEQRGILLLLVTLEYVTGTGRAMGLDDSPEGRIVFPGLITMVGAITVGNCSEFLFVTEATFELDF